MKVDRICRLLALAVLVASPLCVLGQYSATVQGTVSDTSGAAVVNAAVVLSDVSTGVSQTASTDSSGVYHFASLAPDAYQLTASAKGFATAKVNLTLRTEENRDIPVTLSLATASDTVTVTDAAPLLDTSDSRSELTIDTEAIQSLPLPSRNPTLIITMTPGVTGIGAGGGGGGLNFFTENLEASANGRGSTSNQYIVDDLDVNLDVNPGSFTLVPSADALSQITVQTNTYSVDYGKTSSIQTQMTTRSGTNRFHGFASDYYAYQGLYAKGEFGPKAPLNPFHTDNMSFGIGGPIIPNHHTFFFFSVEPFLSQSANGSSVQIYEDPAFVAFAQNAMPDTLETQMIAKYTPSGATTTGVQSTALQAFGAKNTAQNTGCETPSTDNIPCTTPVFDTGVFNSTSFQNSVQYMGRFDQYFTKDRFYFTIFRDTTTTGGPAIRPAFKGSGISSNIAPHIGYTHTFSQNTLDEAQFGWDNISQTNAPTGDFSVPNVSVGGLGVGYGLGFADAQYSEANYHWRDVLTHIHNSHAIRAGYEGWHGNDLALFAPAYAQPAFHFDNMIDLINNNPHQESGLAYNPVTGQPAKGQYEYSATTAGVFAEDTWKVSRNITINYGIRYDDMGNARPQSPTILTNFYLGTGAQAPLGSGVGVPSVASAVAAGALKQGSGVFANGLNWIFSPRGGVAWDITGSGKWIARGGWGIYRDWVTLGIQENELRSNPPNFVLPTFFNNGSTAAPVFGFGTQNTYPFGFPYPSFVGQPLNAAGGIPGSQITIGGIDPYLSSPRSQIWSATLERGVGKTMVASIGYSGQRSANLLAASGNEFNGAYTTDINVFAGDLLQHLTCTPVTPTNGQAATCSGTQTRLNPNFGAITYAYNGPRSTYSALILALKGRFARRGFVTASYTKAVSKDSEENYPAEYSIDQFFGPSPWGVANSFHAGFTYDLPGIDGRSGLLSRVTSGWAFSSNISLQSGSPFNVYTGASLDVARDASGNINFNPDSGDFNADGDNMDFPNVSSYHQSHSRTSFKNGLFQHCPGGNFNNCGPFSLPVPGQEGNEKFDNFIGPGYANVDASLKKSTAIAEGIKLEFRVDFFNLFNRVNFQNVDSNGQDSTFGQSTGTNPARNGLFGAKLEF